MIIPSKVDLNIFTQTLLARFSATNLFDLQITRLELIINRQENNKTYLIISHFDVRYEVTLETDMPLDSNTLSIRYSVKVTPYVLHSTWKIIYEFYVTSFKAEKPCSALF